MLDPATQSRSLDNHATLGRRTGHQGSGTENLPDLLLIERSRAGDEAAIEALIRRYSRRLFRVARSVVPDDERAEAVLQEAYLAAFGDLTRYEPTGKFAAWLTRLAYQQARMQRSGMRIATPAAAAGNGAAVAGTEAEDAQERRELEQAIGALPEVFRTVFVLRVVEGISGIETAASLGVHETTVRTRLYRAHRRLDAETVRRVRAVPALLELPAARLERVLTRVLTHLPHASLLTNSVAAP
jgi:RNA polymerase sigma-70 factor (ECF subfamily)